MRHGSLFSGIGGFDLAASWMGWENVFHCEKDTFCRKILRFYWPEAKSYGDIKKFDSTKYRGLIDVLSGGFPCQPFSIAGRRAGTEDDRYLWPEMLRVIRQIYPRWIVGENVFGLLNWKRGMVFEQVQADLETSGYTVQSFVLPAAGLGAPHRRDRILIVAYAGGNGCSRHPESEAHDHSGFSKGMAKGPEPFSFHCDPDASNTNCDLAGGTSGDLAETSKKGGLENDGTKPGDKDSIANGGRPTSDSNGGKRSEGRVFATGSRPAAGHVIPCDARSIRKKWENFPVESPVCGGNDGLPRYLDGIPFSKWRKESLKGFGNAIVPDLAFQIFRSIEEFDSDLCSTL
jgi:DNA (cytosine-5)-methyltransferase 1